MDGWIDAVREIKKPTLTDPIYDGLNNSLSDYLSKTTRKLIKKKELKTGKNLGIKWLSNGLRHSWISYEQADTADIYRTSEQAGNTPEVARRNYQGLTTKKEAERYFSIRPTIKRKG